jgi:hypothetical protein
VVVGANGAAGGRAALRYAYRDAESIAQVLTSVGGFPRDDVQVLRDPAPAELLAALQRATATVAGRPDGVLFFYFSGHSDRSALFSGGRPVQLEALRGALENPAVSVRVGVIDACQGGGWTRAKGLVPDAPFEVTLPQVLSSEGSALLAASAGDEAAHESEGLGGSFFTVHLAAGLRGAADESGDGEVTLTEAFEYARWRTVRDSARVAREPQHPTYALNLRGRQDLVLSRVAAAPSTLLVTQTEGPLELVHLATGQKVLELPQGARTSRVALPPGRYTVRRVTPAGVRARDVDVPADGAAAVSEAELVSGPAAAATKGSPGDALAPWQGRGELEGTVGFQGVTTMTMNGFWGVQVGDWSSSGTYVQFAVDARLGLTDRLAWKVGTAALAYRAGSSGALEAIPYGGLLGWWAGWGGQGGASSQASVGGSARLGAGLALRHDVRGGYLVLTGELSAMDRYGAAKTPPPRTPPPYPGYTGWDVEPFLDATLSVGAGFRLGAFEFAPGVRWIQRKAQAGRRGTYTLFGSVQELGLYTPPFIRLDLPSRWHLDLYSTWSSDAVEMQTTALAVGRTF